MSSFTRRDLAHRAAQAALALSLASAGGRAPAQAAGPEPLRFDVGLYQADKEKNDATYRPLAEHLARQLGRPVKLYTVDSWEGLAKSLAAGETYIALLPVACDAARLRQEFLAQWPPGSPAWRSYFKRIVDGPDYRPAQAQAVEAA